jgi:hypothetical protein
MHSSKAQTRLDKLDVTTIALISIWFSLLFAVNFIFSKNQSELVFRGIDDVAFQIVLKNAHMALDQGNFAQILSMNDYAYGWLFWIVNTLATYPMHYLLQNIDNDTTLAHITETAIFVIPRQISLVATVTGIAIWMLIYRRISNGSKWINVFVCIVILCSPVIVYVGTKFHPSSLLLLLSALFFYFLLEFYEAVHLDQNREAIRSLLIMFFSFALAVAVKINIVFLGVVFIPVLFYAIKSKVLSGFIPGILIKTTALFTLASFAASPLLLWQTFSGSAPTYVQMIRFQTSKAGDTSVDFDKFIENIKIGLGSNTFDWSIILVSMISFLFFLFCKNQPWFVAMFVKSALIALIAVLVGISILNKQSSVYVVIYLSSLALVVPLGMIAASCNNRLKVVSMAFVCFVLFAGGFERLWNSQNEDPSNNLMALNYIPNLNSSELISSKRQTINNINSATNFNSAPIDFQILTDYRAPIPWSPLEDGLLISYVFDNANLYSNQINSGVYEFVVVSKESTTNIDYCVISNSFPELCSEYGMQQVVNTDLYTLVFEDSYVYVYRKVAT